MKFCEVKKVSKEKFGRIVTNGVELLSHEYKTVLSLTEYGFDIELVRPSSVPYSKNPDLLMGGTAWEMKSPVGNGKYTIQRLFHKAGRQASNVVIDLRRINIAEEKALDEVKKRFEYSRTIRRILILTKSGELLDIKKK